MKTLVLALSMLSASVASGQGCDVREYAQYKDDLKSGSGRIMVAFSYCTNKNTRDSGGPRVAAVCQAEMTKAIDALRSNKEFNTVLFAQGGCNGPMPAK